MAAFGTATRSGLRPGGPASCGHMAAFGTATRSGLRPGGPASCGHMAAFGTPRPVGELSLIAAFQQVLANRSDRVVRWSGDDCAVVRARPVQAVSVDAMV